MPFLTVYYSFRSLVDARACWLDTGKHRGVSLRFWISQERQGVVSWFEFIDFRFSLAFPFCSFGEPYETFGRVARRQYCTCESRS